ncbi:hypothetical protein BDW42DRAFT_192929 [Aspergillus taichungensis]|uniref:Uncharacterized protein n=1 Tax=Aspergillus taichungensis TaxID=482145 RepID=A0A2J5HYP3_9EURO|nr:hypothetical protein BDW42DRAFT_192929 [Aspergillus taichungensis]
MSESLTSMSDNATIMSERTEEIVNFDLQTVFIFHAVYGVPEQPESPTSEYFFQSVFVPLEGGYTGAVALLVSMIYKIKNHPRQVRLRYDTSPEHTGGVWYGLWLDRELDGGSTERVCAAVVEDMERKIGMLITEYNPPTTVREV